MRFFSNEKFKSECVVALIAVSIILLLFGFLLIIKYVDDGNDDQIIFEEWSAAQVDIKKFGLNEVNIHSIKEVLLKKEFNDVKKDEYVNY